MHKCLTFKHHLQLNVEIMGRGYAWLDTGTHESLLEAASFISTLQKRQGLQVSYPEEIAFGQKLIDAARNQKLAAPLAKNGWAVFAGVGEVKSHGLPRRWGASQ